MKTLVIAEHDNTELKIVTRSTLQAAIDIGHEIDVLVAGHNCQSVAAQASEVTGVSHVIVADNAVYAHQLAENTSLLISELADGYSHILASATTNGKNVLPRVAALQNVSQLSDVIEVVTEDTFKRPIYAGNAVATIQSDEKKKIITVRGSAFEAVDLSAQKAEVISSTLVFTTSKSIHLSDEVIESDRPELTSARVVVSGGRGMGSAANFQLLEAVADKLNAGVGASRAAVDAGFVPNDMQIGQTGKIVAPELYIAVGISGAIQHLAGMKDSKFIVAINKDEEAPIFQVADYGLVDDLFSVLPELANKL